MAKKFKTKFDSLVKLKKLKVDEIQNNLSKINTQLQIEKENLEKLKEEFSQLQYPKSGNFGMITQFKMLQSEMQNAINQKQAQIAFINSQIHNLQHHLKEANLEYEKMKYLQSEEIKKYIQKLKKQEEKNIDEIALLLFKNNRED